jgi:hexosaminidase
MLLLAAALLLAPAAAAVPRRPGAARGAAPRAGARAAPRAASEPASVWPMPQSMTLGTSPVALDASFAFSCAGAGCTAVVTAAFDQYADILFFAGPPAPLGAALPGVTGLALTVAADAPLALGVSENYTLALPATGGVATAAADTPWGALRALETFAQLFSWAGNGVPTAYACASAPVAITDFPRWQWRGVLLDSARHFLTPAAIRRAIDAMQATKLNTIHWRA